MYSSSGTRKARLGNGGGEEEEGRYGRNHTQNKTNLHGERRMHINKNSNQNVLPMITKRNPEPRL